ncbi:MAG: hypothetical protein QXT26_02680 [Thermoproteota archaeon]
MSELLSLKLVLRKRVPILARFSRPVYYEEADDWGEFEEAKRKYAGRIRLYVRKEGG